MHLADRIQSFAALVVDLSAVTVQRQLAPAIETACFRIARDAGVIAGRIQQEIRRPFRIRGHDVETAVGIGVAFCPWHSVQESELLHGADLALYPSKQGGRNAFKVFGNDMLSEKEQKESVRIELEHALDQGGFSLVQQPIVAARTRVLHWFKAFARWRHPQRV